MTYEELYRKIRLAYNCPWPDNAAEREGCSKLLEAVITQAESTVDQLLAKAKAAGQAHGTTKYKMINLLESRYWEIRYPGEFVEFHVPRYNPYQL